MQRWLLSCGVEQMGGVLDRNGRTEEKPAQDQAKTTGPLSVHSDNLTSAILCYMFLLKLSELENGKQVINQPEKIPPKSGTGMTWALIKRQYD